MELSTTTAMYRFREDKSYIPIIESVTGLHAAGYPNVDINLCMADRRAIELTEDGWENWAHSLREHLDHLGVTAGQSHVPFYRYREGNPSDYQLSERSEEMIRRGLIASGILGVGSVTFHSIMTDPTNAEKNRADNVEYFKRHLELAEKCGVSIAIENAYDPLSSTGERRYRYSGRLDELIDLVDTLSADFKNVGICWDFGHANEAKEDQVAALKRIGKRLIATHVDDNYGQLDDHLTPFLGTVDWLPIMPTLKEIGYDKCFAFETHKFTANLPDAFVEEALRYTVRLGNYLLSLAR